MILRPAEPRDAAAIRAIEQQSGCTSWRYLYYQCTVAEIERMIVGYLLTRKVAENEFEILNLAVAPHFRRRGIAESLLRAHLNGKKGQWFLEVRESNVAARSLYAKLGFHEAGRRPEYYSDPPEAAVVMMFRSC